MPQIIETIKKKQEVEEIPEDQLEEIFNNNTKFQDETLPLWLEDGALDFMVEVNRINL